MHSDVPMREHSFLNSSRIHPADKADIVKLTVASPAMPTSTEATQATAPNGNTSVGNTSVSSGMGMHTSPAIAPSVSQLGQQQAQPSTQPSASPAAAARQLQVSAGDHYGKVAEALQAQGWGDAFLVQVAPWLQG